MKKILLIIAAILSSFVASAQNTFPSSGNAGIGTTSPTSLLTVSGNNGGSAPGLTATFSSNMGSGTTIGNQVNISSTTAAWGLLAGYDGSGVASSAYHSPNAAYLINVQSGPLHLGTNNAPCMSINSTGNVGIGTISPAYNLDVNGVIHSSVGSGSNLLLSKGSGASVAFDNSSGTQTALIEAGTSDNRLEFWTNTATNTGLVERMRISNGGNVSIGTTDAKGYTLAVNGSAIATSMTVKLNANWPDYVFKPTYSLPSLSEVKTYIDKNQHLPELPSEREIVKYGLNLGEMNKLLVKKVEELTLYLIQQKEESERQKEKNEQQNIIQQRQIDELRQQINRLIK